MISEDIRAQAVIEGRATNRTALRRFVKNDGRRRLAEEFTSSRGVTYERWAKQDE
jgi:hypothetical protein